MSSRPISTFIINLKHRTDRRAHILEEFKGRDEFAITFVEPKFHPIGAVSLWETIKFILSDLSDSSEDYILLCEDDHSFTLDYCESFLHKGIEFAKSIGADVLAGGIHWFNSGLRITENIYWVDQFTGTQFILVFKQFFDLMISADFSENDAADRKISDLSNRVLFFAPFISVQKDFGYSDATPKNNCDGEMKKLFSKSTAAIQTLAQVFDYYQSRSQQNVDTKSFDDICIPTYIINKKDIINSTEEFLWKKEFELSFIEPVQNKLGIHNIWLTIQGIVKRSAENDDDVVVICYNDQRFSKSYTKSFFLKNVIDAHEQGVEILIGGAYSFGLAVPVSSNRAWVNHFSGATFFVIYRSAFSKILSHKADQNFSVDKILSSITSHKMIFFPFISEAKNLVEDKIAIRDSEGDVIVSLLEPGEPKLAKLYTALNIFGTNKHFPFLTREDYPQKKL